jgi:hypothetical protein
MMLLPLATALSITALAKEAGIHLTTSPFQGGQNKNALLVLDDAIAGGGVISIDGSNLIQDTAPAAADASWSSIVTLEAGSPTLQEILLPVWIRVNITTVGTGTVNIALQGVQ